MLFTFLFLECDSSQTLVGVAGEAGRKRMVIIGTHHFDKRYYEADGIEE
jgi:hypothetical protein